MSKAVIFMKKDSFIYKDKEYDFNVISEIKHQFKSDLKIIILEEELYGRQFVNNAKGNQIYKFVEYKINTDFMQNGDILYDFQKRNNIIVIYYIKGAKRVEKLSEKTCNLEVKPIQFIVKAVMGKVLNNEKFNCSLLVKFLECYYYMTFENGLFYSGFVSKDKELMYSKIIENNELEEVYIDCSIEEDLFDSREIKLIKINLGELINEKIYEKQKFYTRKIL
ncbi:hypothetical protein [Clostridium sp. C2-6-12]|uniref:hypothetical protein n=1 Tax=Clostridium sp. C2-6-12 TaxID=2698832 RepID=UPI00137089DB|nr:hypothetical protein [Clostridium sp. C2-6-12]